MRKTVCCALLKKLVINLQNMIRAVSFQNNRNISEKVREQVNEPARGVFRRTFAFAEFSRGKLVTIGRSFFEFRDSFANPRTMSADH